MVKDSLFKWLKGGKQSAAAPPFTAPDTEPGAAEDSVEPQQQHTGQTRSGQTIFSADALDPALRFRSLTVTEPDSAALEGEPQHQPAFKIRLAKSVGFRREAGGLVGRRYSDRGYLIPQATQDPHLFTFLAYDEGQLVGTVSVRVDSAEGLSADQLYKDELQELRQNGCTLSEFTRLAVDVKSASKPVLAGLFHTAYLYAMKVRGVKYGVIEVNPRHVPFYRRSLKFEPLGGERTNLRVNAPAVLMCISYDMVNEMVGKYGGKPELAATERLLYPHFFSLGEEGGILERLKELDAASR
ncbi:MAG TPA: hypothetical protein VJM53_05420 [Burkholderiales bacterium]|nr:hypothetical protein [Burkholderiales bacterium]